MNLTPDRNHKRTMSTKPQPKKTPKPAAPAGKKAPAKIPPLVLTGATIDGTGILNSLDALTVIRLKDLMKERGVPIPKSKIEMANRLHDWFCRPGGTFTLTLG